MYNWYSAGYYTSFGTGPFIAGAQSASISFNGAIYGAQPVWWSDLNSANTCDPSLNLQKWTTPNNLCNSNNQFVIPSAAQGIQACTILATIFSFFSCSIGCSMARLSRVAGPIAAVSALLAMIFSIAAFSIWATWPMAQRYRSSSNPAFLGGTQVGDYIPLWVTPATGTQAKLGLSITPIPLYYGKLSSSER
jgi:hypothetical protein